MASLSFTLANATSSCSPFFPKPATQPRPLNTHAKQHHRFHVSCNVSSDDHEKPLSTNPQPQKLILPQTSLDLQNVDRRNLLLGLGGLYSTVNLQSAFAEPISSPPLELPSLEPSCTAAGSGFNPSKVLLRSTACCPPRSKKGPETNFDVNSITGPTRVRKPIHSSPEDVKKYMAALEIMRGLGDDDPRSFTNQAKIHCAYCNGSYKQSGQELQIHNTWLFYPFHRWYLFFYERILGDLIKDPTFALPYWNWDNLDGMEFPDLFIDEKVGSKPNSLYDVYRNQTHLRSAVVDLDYQGKDRTDGFDQKEINLATMNRQMLRNSFDSASFFGGKYVAGNLPVDGKDNVVGAVEAGVHTAIHRWVGNPDSTRNGEDMGNFYSAGYDPLFYVHHSNVDRMWSLWKQMGGKEPEDKDWGEASYVFYNEKQEPVRVYNKDAADLDKLKFRYAESATPWMDRPPRSRCYRPGMEIRTKSQSFTDIDKVDFPLSLTETKRLRIRRPDAAINRSAEQKKKEKEVLCITGIMFDGTKAIKFDVLVNECDTVFTPCDSENVGSFAAVPHAKAGAMGCASGMRFSLSELLEETKAEGDKYITVTISPQKADDNIATIGNIEIRLIPVFQN